ncbi:MAG: aminotransferase class I/II-fold pyridoxal phosphate-dependent enzyme [Synechococcaceae bacterium WB9_2_112]|nr:aminotransferase class I/II-fold pyridoxal phosphate-dependent enzyme [Synechococcaceae bacterium WB9_2_112]
MRVDPPRSGSPERPGPARRLEGVLQPVIPVISALVRDTPGCLSLAQGMVSWGPPPGVAALLAAAADAMAGADDAAALNRYGAMAGDPALLEAIRRNLTAPDRPGAPLQLDGATVLVTAGSNMAFNAIAQVITDPGDELILPLPCYFNHAMAVQLAGGVAVPVDAGLIPDPDQLASAITPRTRAIVTVSPNNPSGVVMPRAVLEAINRLCALQGLFHIHDEAYEHFVHGQTPHWSPGSEAGSGEHTISLFSLSKAYGMAGWRLGYAVVPVQLSPGLAQVQDTVLICPPRITQRAAVAALSAGPDWCRPRVARLAALQQQLVAAVARARAGGLPLRLLAEPDGAFYGLLALEPEASQRLSAAGVDGRTLMVRLASGHGVACLSGDAFGLVGHALRLSTGMVDGPTLAVALERLFGGIGALLSEA